MDSAERLWEWKRFKTLERRERLEELKRKKAAGALKEGGAASPPEPAGSPAIPPVGEASADDPNSNGILYPPSSLLPPDYSPASDAANNYDSGYQYGYGYSESTAGIWSTESATASPSLVDSSNYYNDGSNYTDYYGNTTSNGWDNWNASAGYADGTGAGGYEYYQDAAAPATGGDYYYNGNGYADGDYNAYWTDEGAGNGGETYDACEYDAAPVVDCAADPYAAAATGEVLYEQAPVVDEYSIDVGSTGYPDAYYSDQHVPTSYGNTDASGSPWEEVFDPQTGQTYYYNRETSETAWERPAA